MKLDDKIATENVHVVREQHQIETGHIIHATYRRKPEIQQVITRIIKIKRQSKNPISAFTVEVNKDTTSKIVQLLAKKETK